MRSPFDDAIAAQQNEAVVEEQDPARAAERRPPGGKPLLRLMALLQRDGFAEPAATAVALAVPDDARAAFEEHLARLGAAPEAKAKAPARARGRGRAAAKKDAAPSTEEIAEAYRETGERSRAADADRPAVALARPVDDPQRPDLRRQPRQRLRARRRRSRSTRPTRRTCSAARRTAASGRASTAAPAGRRAPTTQPTLTVGAIAFDPARPGDGLLRHRRGQLVGLARRGHAALHRRRHHVGARSAPRPSSARASTTWRSIRRTATTSSPAPPAASTCPPTAARPGPSGARRATWSLSMARPAATAEILAACSRRRLPLDQRRHDVDGGGPARRARHPSTASRSPSRRRTRRSPTSGARAAAHRLPVAARPAGTWTRVPVPPGRQHRAGLVRLVPRRRARQRHPDLLRRDRDLPRRPHRARRGRGRTSATRARPATRSTPTSTRSPSSRATRTRSTSAATAASSARPTAASPGRTATTGWSSPSSSTSPRTRARPAG